MRVSLFEKLASDRGFTLPVVMGVIIIISILAIGLSLTVENHQSAVQRDDAKMKSLQVAEAGVNDYLYHLNKDSEYYLRGVHPAEGKGKWVRKNGGEYNLEITPPADDEPLVQVKATGKVKNRLGADVTTTITASYRKKVFTQYIYLTNHESYSQNNPIWWITGDVVRGPLHTNEDLFIDGDPVFQGRVSMGGNLTIRSGNPVFEEGYKEHAETLDFPSTNDKLKLEAQARGYYYYGQTTITLRSDGYMEIVNSDGSGRTTGPTGVVPIPDNGVVYVDGLRGNKYVATNGDVFISGTLRGKLTIGSANIIWITGDLNYSDDAADMLGLVATDSILINHYDSSDRDVAPYNVTIKGALFALENSFGFERYNQGSPKGTITFVGSMVQNTRGPVGTFNSRTGQKLTGYSKNYNYDKRMLYKSPPHFVEPLNAGFELVGWTQSK